MIDDIRPVIIKHSSDVAHAGTVLLVAVVTLIVVEQNMESGWLWQQRNPRYLLDEKDWNSNDGRANRHDNSSIGYDTNASRRMIENVELQTLKSTHYHKNQTWRGSSWELQALAQTVPWQETCPTTIVVLLLIHFIFLYQWNARTKRRHILVSYRTLIEKRLYHKAPLAFLSHPPTNKTNLTNGNNNLNSQTSAAISRSEQDSSTLLGRLSTRLRNWHRSSSLTNGRHLSGLPLLFYNSHILWSCRALEFGHTRVDPYSYARLMFGVACVAVGLELWLTDYMLRLLVDSNHATSSPILIGGTRRRSARRQYIGNRLVAQYHQQLLSHRTMGSMTVTTSALVTIFRYRFPHTPIQILPILSSFHIPFLSDPTVSFLLTLNILLWISFPTHPVLSVVCGLLSGWLWVIGLTSFLGQPYWFFGLIFVVALLCALSLKVSGSPWVPCIDSVGWDAQGRIRPEASHEPSGIAAVLPYPEEYNDSDNSTGSNSLEDDNDTDDNDDDDDDYFGEEDNDADDDLESGLVLLQNRHYREQEEDDRQQLHHRLPFMGEMDDDNDDTYHEEDSLLRPGGAGAGGGAGGGTVAVARTSRSSPTIRSRRTMANVQSSTSSNTTGRRRQQGQR